MEISITQKSGRANVTLLHLKGKLDGGSYRGFVEAAQKVYDSGAMNILIDLTDVSFLSSAGISGLHSVALMFRGEKSDPEAGWDAFRAIDRDRGSGVQKHVKLLNPQPEVLRVIEMVGFSSFFEVYMDLENALSSF